MAATGSTGQVEELSKDGIVVKTYTVNRKEGLAPNIYPPTMTEATLVDGIYWAPVNVGATAVGEQGLLFQYGRMKGWANAQAMGDAVLRGQISIAEADKDPDICYVYGGNSDNRWWSDAEPQKNIDALVARWSAVSDGSNNPCPKGWRLPTKVEADALLAGQKPTHDDTNLTATVRGLVFPKKEYFYGPYNGSVSPNEGRYYLAAYYHGLQLNGSNFSVFEDSSNMHQSISGYSIRCVKTAP